MKTKIRIIQCIFLCLACFQVSYAQDGLSKQTRIVNILNKDTKKGLPKQKLIIQGHIEFTNVNDSSATVNSTSSGSRVVMIYDTIEFKDGAVLYTKSNFFLNPRKFLIGHVTIVSLRGENGMNGKEGVNSEGKSGNGPNGANGGNGSDGSLTSSSTTGGNGGKWRKWFKR